MTRVDELGLGPTRVTHRRYVRWACSGLLLAVLLAVILAPILAPYGPTDLIAGSNLPPSAHYLLGTDELGRDVLSRLLYGGRIPLLSALVSTALAGLTGTTLGMIAGFSRNILGSLIMRAIDILLAFPTLIVGFIVVAILGRGTTQVILAVAISFVPMYTRVIYSSTLSVRSEDYVLACRSLGVRTRGVLFGHVLPNIRPEVVVLSSSIFGWSLLLDATFSFLGLGVAPPSPDWGADLAAGRDVLYQAWWVSAAPGAAIAITILCANLLGDEISQGSRSGNKRLRWYGLRTILGLGRRVDRNEDRS